MRKEIPEERDSHLFGVERTIRQIVEERALTIEGLISEAKSTMPDHIAACTTSAESDFRCKYPGICLGHSEPGRGRSANDYQQNETMCSKRETPYTKVKVAS